MKHFIFFAIFSVFFAFCISKNIQAQKPSIDTSVYDKWPSVSDVKINNNGTYVYYLLRNQPPGVSMLVLQSSDSKWRLDIPKIGNVGFCSNNKDIVFTIPGDSLVILKLGTSTTQYLTHIRTFNLLKNGKDEWLVCSLTKLSNRFLIRNIESGAESIIDDVAAISDNGNRINILVQSQASTDALSEYILKWRNLSSDSTYTVWKGRKAQGFVFDQSGTNLAFTVNLDSISGKSFWLYKPGMSAASLLLDNKSVASFGLALDGIRRFAKDGSKLFFSVSEPVSPRPPGSVPVVVWNYKDAKLQSLQQKELGPRTYAAELLMNSRTMKRLTFENEPIANSTLVNPEYDDVALIEHWDADFDNEEDQWNATGRGTEYLILTGNGERTPIIKLEGNLVQEFRLSPKGKFVLYYDRNKRNYISYEIRTGQFRNVTKNIPADWENDGSEYPRRGTSNSAFSAWIAAGNYNEERYVLLHDSYDLWLVDLLGTHLPINVTNGFGKRHQIVFRLLEDDNDSPVFGDSKIILSAFDKLTKDNGFYSTAISAQRDPELLTMGPYIYYAPDNNPDLGDMKPVKAKDSAVYVVRRMSCTEAPNYFSTSDFKTFTRLSDIHPEKSYNWMTSELFNWTTLDGRVFQGVLYKPENFDPHRKYPLIFYYYEGKSDMKNVYIEPGPSTGPINIPQYVTNGYLVATPDIHYTVGETGKSAVNSVVSAAQYLSKKPWVNAKAIGIQGMSFGGYETNYLVTHSHLFAAACSASGTSDLISNYSFTGDWGRSYQRYFELEQFRLGQSLSDNLNLYIENSPLFSAKNVTTPLLMMHTLKDGIFPFSNAIEFFSLLRRLGKKVWLLEYDDGHHTVDGKSALDFTIRAQQFFDHYLKGFPEPVWMSRGIPARLRGIDNGFELDNAGK